MCANSHLGDATVNLNFRTVGFRPGQAWPKTNTNESSSKNCVEGPQDNAQETSAKGVVRHALAHKAVGPGSVRQTSYVSSL